MHPSAIFYHFVNPEEGWPQVSGYEQVCHNVIPAHPKQTERLALDPAECVPFGVGKHYGSGDSCGTSCG